MTETIIHIDLDAIDERLDHGKLWSRNWGDWGSADGQTCLHGAIRFCQPVPGDAYLIEQVGAQFGFGTEDNDSKQSWDAVKASVVPDITDVMLFDTFGPQWSQIVDLVRGCAALTIDQANNLSAARDAARGAAWDAARDAAWDAVIAAARDAAWDAVWDAARGASRYAARYAARGLVGRDLIGQHGFTQDHYDTLTGPWRKTIGPIHPDDKPLR